MSLFTLLAGKPDPGGGGYIGLGNRSWGDCIDPQTGVATLRCIPVVFGNAVNALLIFSGTVALIMVIWSGYKYILSKGDAKQAEEAKKTLTWTLIGLTIIILSFAVINLISYVTGVECIRLFGFGNCQ